MERKVSIAITGTGSLIGQAIIKSLKQSNLQSKIKLIGFDYFDYTVGSFWCEQNYILPDILKPSKESEWFNLVLDIIQKERIFILFIGLDFELLLFAKYKDEIEKNSNCKVVVSDEQLLKIGNDKYLTYQFLKDHNLNYPKTFLPVNFDQSKIGYPFIIKPRVGARSKGVYIIKNEKEFLQNISQVHEPIIQELIGNDETEYTCGVLCFDNKIVDLIVLKRSLKEGNTYIAEYKTDFPPIIYEYIRSIAQILNPFGPCNLQLRLDEQGRPNLFEINPRFSGTTYFRSLFGFKEVEYTANYLLSNALLPFTMKDGKAYRYFEEKLL